LVPPKFVSRGIDMLRNLALIFQTENLKRSPILVILSLAIVLAFSFVSTCCNTSTMAQSAASSQPPAQTSKHISIQPQLPSAIVGTQYRAVLSVNGGQAPYIFVINQGTLPPGLSLNRATGSLFGIPTQAGSFSFSILVTDDSSKGSGSRSYTLTVSPCLNCVTVQISPTNPSVTAGGNIQFSAVVGNTSNTAVTWSASAGTISANGLFTAPSAPSPTPVTVTATSAAQNTAQASTVVTITTVTSLTITTSSVPSGIKNSPYSASLNAKGGQPPYQWSLASGTLPAGVKLAASTGTLSGSATQAGTFAFSVQAQDAASHTAVQSLSLPVSGSSTTCGPPAYPCSRTDSTVVQIPSSIPNVGNLTGANTIVTDPDFGNRIVRITDWNTDPGAQPQNRSFVSAASGSADENLWNVDSTMFIVQALGDAAYPFTFDPSTLQATRMYVSSNPSRGGLKLSASGMWSRVDPNVMYSPGSTGTSITKYDFSDRTNPPSPQEVYDFTSSPNCLPRGFTQTWKSKAGVSADDTVFGMGYSNTGNQGTGVYAVAYKAGSGCTVLNTKTGQVWGDWGAAGTINIPDRWTIHNVKLSKDGNWLIVAKADCLISSCSNGPYFWQIGTTNVSSCGDGQSGGQHCSGHWTEGYSHWINNYDGGKYVIRPLSDPTALNVLNATVPAGVINPLDQHASWNNVDPADSLPFFLTYWSPITPFPGPWYDEITAVAPNNSGKVWRFAHSFITGHSQIFNTMYGIGSVSQDGRFFIFSSDWMGTLGSQSAAPNCTVGTDCRGDVFVLELK